MKAAFHKMLAFMPTKMLISEFSCGICRNVIFFGCLVCCETVWWDTSGNNFSCLRQSRCGEGKPEVRSRSGGRSVQTWRLAHVDVNTSGGHGCLQRLVTFLLFERWPNKPLSGKTEWLRWWIDGLCSIKRVSVWIAAASGCGYNYDAASTVWGMQLVQSVSIWMSACHTQSCVCMCVYVHKPRSALFNFSQLISAETIIWELRP